MYPSSGVGANRKPLFRVPGAEHRRKRRQRGRFGQVLVDPGFFESRGVPHIAGHRDEKDFLLTQIGSKSRRHLVTVHSWQPEIEEHDFGLELAYGIDGGGPRMDRKCSMARGLE